jgi:hypothetical protein
MNRLARSLPALGWARRRPGSASGVRGVPVSLRRPSSPLPMEGALTPSDLFYGRRPDPLTNCPHSTIILSVHHDESWHSHQPADPRQGGSPGNWDAAEN